MSLTNYGEAEALGLLFTGTFYVALFTTQPDETGAGTEVSGGDYERAACTFTITGTAPTRAENAGPIAFPVATASWGTVVAAAVYDAMFGGNMIGFTDSISSTPTVGVGESVDFATGALDITLD